LVTLDGWVTALIETEAVADVVEAIK